MDKPRPGLVIDKNRNRGYDGIRANHLELNNGTEVERLCRRKDGRNFSKYGHSGLPFDPWRSVGGKNRSEVMY